MTTVRQIASNRLNALKSTGPRTEAGKLRSRRNAVRHGLTAETVISNLEDGEDYAAFEQAVTADYAPQTVVERELVLRLASLLWRLRRATTIETGMFESEREAAAETPTQIPPDVDTQLCFAELRRELRRRFVRLHAQHRSPLDRLSRYEAGLWRQTRQVLGGLSQIYNRKPRHVRRHFELAN